VEATDTAAAPDGGQEPPAELRRAEEQLAAAEAAHWQSEFDLADAEAAVEAADDAVSSLDTKRIEARRDRVTAQRHLAEAQSRQRNAVNLLAEARRRLDAAKRMSDRDE
jgi:chromosome segregation ATPase